MWTWPTLSTTFTFTFPSIHAFIHFLSYPFPDRTPLTSHEIVLVEPFLVAPAASVPPRAHELLVPPLSLFLFLLALLRDSMMEGLAFCSFSLSF